MVIRKRDESVSQLVDFYNVIYSISQIFGPAQRKKTKTNKAQRQRDYTGKTEIESFINSSIYIAINLSCFHTCGKL